MFIQITAAMADFIPKFEAYHGSCEPERTAPLKERLEWRYKQEDSKAAQRVVVAAYASELLPAILGGAWRRTESAVREPTGLRYYGRPIYSDYYTLFDHPLHFRRAGTKGMATWTNAVVVGRPYNIFKDGNPRDEAVRHAESLVEKHHVGVWARPDLSAWYPGSTALVIAGKGLRAEDADRFGFVALAGE